MKYTKKELEQIREINETLERMENKLDQMIAMMNKSSTLNIKGFWNKPKKHSDGDYYEDYE